MVAGATIFILTINSFW